MQPKLAAAAPPVYRPTTGVIQCGQLDSVEQEKEFNECVRVLKSHPSAKDRDEAIAKLSALMLNEHYFARVASDPDLFRVALHRVKEPDRATVTREAPEIAAKRQEIHSTYDQLQYILARTGTHRGLANRKWSENPGTETYINMDESTARSVQFDAIAKLILLFAGEQVRMPVYSHRVGPMQGKSYDPDRAAATNLNSILGSTDECGANLRVTQADRGPGAYVSTDSDTFYGPHGFTFDPRDLHQLPLSKDSLDNQREISSERMAHERHQFRAVGNAIHLTTKKDNAATPDERTPLYSAVFVSTSKEQLQLLNQVLDPKNFTPGVLANQRLQFLREQLRRVYFGNQPPAHAPRLIGGTQEDAVSNEHAYLMQPLVQQLNGIYEPLSWADGWKNLIENQIASSMSRMVDAVRQHNKEEDIPDDDGWDDDVPSNAPPPRKPTLDPLLNQYFSQHKYNTNNCLIHAIAGGAGVTPTAGQITQIRNDLLKQGIPLGAFIEDNQENVQLIMLHLGLGGFVYIHNVDSPDHPAAPVFVENPQGGSREIHINYSRHHFVAAPKPENRASGK